MTDIYGQLVDGETRCVHYDSPLDIVAIKFKCCAKYYACFACHQELENHEAVQWVGSEFNQLAILCGNCWVELTIEQYLDSRFTCPSCCYPFNEGCRLHYEHYFDMHGRAEA